MRETGIFTGTTSSLCLSLRQLPDRYAIRAGRNLPDKEFRSDIVTPTFVDGLVISANLCMSPCSTDYIFIFFEDAWRVVSEDSKNLDGFLRFIVCAIFAISMMPLEFRCFLSPINSSTARELLEVLTLSSSELILLKERNDLVFRSAIER